jgi:tetratricopeptide (TPR) repeat protein
MADVLVMYSEIARAIAGEIQVKLTPEEETRLASARQVNPEAYEAYLKGQFHLGKMTPPDLETALKYYEMALKKDPNFALAYAGISLSWAFRNQMGFVLPREATPQAKAAAQRALELDNTLAEVHYSLAIIKTWGEWDWEGAEKAFRRAIELNPNYPDVCSSYSHLLIILHRPDEAMVQIERALELDPFNALFQSFYSAVLLFLRRYDDTIEQCQNVLRTVPNHWLALGILQTAFHQKRMYDKSLETFKAQFAAMDFHEGEKALTRGYEEAGYTGAMNSLTEMLAELSRTTYFSPYMIADTHVLAGNNDQVLYWLERGFEVRDPNIPYIGVMPHFVDLLRDDPRFQDLLRKMNLPELE